MHFIVSQRRIISLYFSQDNILIKKFNLETNPLISVDQDILSLFSFLIYLLGKQLKQCHSATG